MTHFDANKFLKELERLNGEIPHADTELEEASSALLRRLRSAVAHTETSLRELLSRLDRVRRLGEPYNPASPEAFSQSIANSLLLQTAVPLNDLNPFYGSGVYALFYKGDFPAYTGIAGTRIPIYVGKADPKGSKALTSVEQGPALFRRLSEHRDSITEAQNHRSKSIRVADFECRFLVLDSAWQVVSETYLIRTFRPIWNKETKICTGIGKHGDSSDTRDNRRSAWDTLHPGRSWADDAQANKRPRNRIIADLIQHSAMYLDPTFDAWRKV